MAAIRILAAAFWAIAAAAPAAALVAPESVEAEIRVFREAIEENLLDDEAYARLVDALRAKGWLNGDLERFKKLLPDIVRPDETVAHHRLAYALEEKGFAKESAEVEPFYVKGTFENPL
jgi:regulator of extracellular matrix RemA (YlzA/DUF370 family)